MEFSSLVLMERDKETNMFVRELGSYEVGDGAEYIKKMFYDGEKINVFFDTNVDVEEWEYSAIFDLFEREMFTSAGFEIDDIDEEYNPTWEVKFDYDEEHSIVQERINELCTIIDTQISKVFEDIKGKESQYV